MADPARKLTTEQDGEETVIHETTSVTKTIYQAPDTSAPANDNNLTPGEAVNDNAQTNTSPSPVPSPATTPTSSSTDSPPGTSFPPGNAANDNAQRSNPAPTAQAEANQTKSPSQAPKTAPSPQEDSKKPDQASDSAKDNENKNQSIQNNDSQQPLNNDKSVVNQAQPSNATQVPSQNQNQAPKPNALSNQPTTLPTSQGRQTSSPTQAQSLNANKPNSRLGRKRLNRPLKSASKNNKMADSKKDQSKGKNSSEKSKTDTKTSSLKVATPSSSKKAPGIAKGRVKDLANVKQEAVKAVAGKAVDKLGKWAGLNAVQKEFILHCVGLVIELLAVIIGIGLIAFIIHLFVVIGFLLKKDNFNQVQPLILLFSVVLTIEGIAVFTFIAAVIPALVCQVGQSRIPSGIPPGVVSRIGAVFHADIGAFDQLCSQINLAGAGVGNGLSTNRSNSSNNAATASNQNQNLNNPVLAQSMQNEPNVAIIPGTVLTIPQTLPPEFATQTNQAGYLSPAECRLGDLPYSNETSLQRIRLGDGTERIVSLPVHQTVECIQNDPTKVSVRSIHTGKVVRLVYDDPKLGNYITIEYPNNLRLSYYHLSLLPNLTLAQTITAGEVIGNLAQTGENTFRGVTFRFELKSIDGTWQPFDPFSPNPAISILTAFPCSSDASKRCLVL